MNPLIGRERAIVSPYAGTTRDTVHAELQIDGFHVVLTDTAGIREVGEGIEQEGFLLTELRHKQALQEAATLLDVVIKGLGGNISAEFLLFDLRSSLKALGKIIGSDITEDILSAIFSRFCIGK